MAERHKSKDGRRETEEILGDKSDVAQQGRSGGRLARTVGTKDEMKRTEERPAGATRVTKSMEDEEDSNES
ncbi:hypothetical protein [Marivita sp.]|jgi:hypothetical protein|uniref:hypothetical protein n=1 Tax=Marivita sp. TaxID=2003365 RepID=UPI003F6E6947